MRVRSRGGGAHHVAEALAWRMRRHLLEPVGELSLAGVVSRLCGVHGQVLAWKPPSPLAGIVGVRIETDASPSFVAWKEIEVLG